MKFLVVVLISVMFIAASARLVSFNEEVKIYEQQHEAMDAEEIDSIRSAKEVLYTPTTIKDCSNSACDYICRLLGYRHGTCVSNTTCRCYT